MQRKGRETRGRATSKYKSGDNSSYTYRKNSRDRKTPGANYEHNKRHWREPLDRGPQQARGFPGQDSHNRWQTDWQQESWDGHQQRYQQGYHVERPFDRPQYQQHRYDSWYTDNYEHDSSYTPFTASSSADSSSHQPRWSAEQNKFNQTSKSGSEYDPDKSDRSWIEKHRQNSGYGNTARDVAGRTNGSPLPRKKRDKKDEVESAEESKDTRTEELSLKTSQIIDCVIHGVKPVSKQPKTSATKSSSDLSRKPHSTSNTAAHGKKSEDILSKAEKLVESFRGQRQAAKEKKSLDQKDKDMDLVSSSVTKHLPNWRKVASDIASKKPSGTYNSVSTKHKASSLPAKSLLSTSSKSHCDSLPSSTFSKSNSTRKPAENLKDTVVRMLKYPKSRRGIGQVEKFLQKQKVASSSHRRLLNLMQPLSQPENRSVEFSQLAPDVQKHILSLLDEVVEDIDPNDVVLLSDDDRCDGSSDAHPGIRSPQYIASTPADSGQVSFADASEIMDIRDHFNDLLPEDQDLSSIMNASMMDEVDDPMGTASQAEPDYSPAVRQGLQIVDRLITDIRAESMADRTSQNISKASSIIEEARKDVRKATSINTENSGRSSHSQSKKSLHSDTAAKHTKPSSDNSLSGVSKIPRPAEAAETQDTWAQSEVTAEPSFPGIHVINHPIVAMPSTSIIKIEPQDPNLELSDLTNTSNETVIQVPISRAKSVLPSATACSTLEEPPSRLSRDSAGQEENDSGKISGKRSRNTSTTVSDEGLDATENVDSPGSENPKQAKQAKLSQELGGICTPMDELYHISMEEDQVHQKIIDTEQIIRELTEILESTKSRLQDREKHKKQLQEKESLLRKRRIGLLRGMTSQKANTSSLNVGHASDTDSVHSPATHREPRSLHSNATLHLTCETVDSLPSPTQPGHVLKMEPDTTEGLNVKCDVPPAGTSHSMEVDSSPHCAASDCAGTNALQAITDTLRQWSDTEKAPERASDDEGEGRTRRTSSHSEGEPGDGALSVKYLGSFTQNEGVGNIIRKLASDFKHLKKTSYVLLNEDDENQTEEPKGVPAEVAESCDSDVSNKSERSTKHKKPSKVNSKKSTLEKDESQSADQTKFKVPKVPEAIPLPKSKGRQRKQKDQLPCSESENDEKSGQRAKTNQPKKKKKGKQKDKGTSKIMKEYLHGSSSTDVEIEGLEPQNLSSVNSSCLIDVSDSGSDARSTGSPRSAGQVEDFVKRPHCGLFVPNPYKGCIGSCNITAMAICKGRLLAAGSNGKIASYNRFKRKTPCIKVFSNHTSAVPVLFVSPQPGQKNLHQIYTGGEDQFLVSMIEHGRGPSEYKCSAAVRCSCYNWGKLYLGLADGMVVVFSTQRYHVEKTFEVSSKKRAITQIATAQEGSRRMLCVCEQDEVAIFVRDAKNHLFLRALEGHVKPPTVMTVKNHRVFSGGSDNTVQIHNLNTGETEALLRFRSTVTCILVDRHLFVGEKRGVINLIQLKDHVRQRVFYTNDSSAVDVLCLDAENDVIYVANRSKNVEAMHTQCPTVACQYSACAGFLFSYEGHLVQHLMKDHIAPLLSARATTNTEIVEIKCLWKSCTESMESRDVEEHMREHAVASFQS